LIVLETTREWISGRDLPGGSLVGWGVNSVYFALENLLFLRYYVFIDFHAYGDPARVKRLERKSLVFWLVFLAALAVTTITGWLYSVGPRNVYARGPAFAVIPVLSYGIVFFAILRAFLAKNRMEPRGFWPLILFPIPTIVGGTVQLADPSKPYLWAGAAISMLIVFLHIQNERLNRDYLTGAWNRRFLDEYLENYAENRGQKPDIAGLFLDLDGFKALNDAYGHDAGDQALQMAASILKSCVRGGDFLARYAGDEFVIILEDAKSEALKRVEARIETEMARFNGGHSRPYTLSLSIGSAIYDRRIDGSAQDFLRRLDALMYENKQAKKRAGKGEPPPKTKA